MDDLRCKLCWIVRDVPLDPTHFAVGKDGALVPVCNKCMSTHVMRGAVTMTVEEGADLWAVQQVIAA